MGLSALVVTPAVPQDLQTGTERPVTLAAHVQPLPTASAPVAVVAPPPPLGLLGEQVHFHVELLVDFIVTGAQLASRIPPVARTLLQDIQGGTPVRVAVSRALVGFADVEFDAGRELIGFAEEWADFQIQFLSDLISKLPAIISSGPVGQFATAALAMASAPVDNVAEFARGVVTTAENFVHDVLEPPVSTRVVSASAARDTSGGTSVAPGVTPRSAAERSDESSGSEKDSDDTASAAEDADVKRPNTMRKRGVSAQGEIRTGARDSTDSGVATTGASESTEQPDKSYADKPKDKGGSEDATANDGSASNEG